MRLAYPAPPTPPPIGTRSRRTWSSSTTPGRCPGSSRPVQGCVPLFCQLHPPLMPAFAHAHCRERCRHSLGQAKCCSYRISTSGCSCPRGCSRSVCPLSIHPAVVPCHLAIPLPNSAAFLQSLTPRAPLARAHLSYDNQPDAFMKKIRRGLVRRIRNVTFSETDRQPPYWKNGQLIANNGM